MNNNTDTCIMNRIGIIGYHPASENIIELLKQNEEIVLSGFFTAYPLDNELMKLTGLRMFDSLNELLENSDRVICLLHDETVLNTVEKSIKFGKDIYVHELNQFPLDYINYLAKLCTEAGVKSALNVELGFHNVIETLKEFIAQAQLIEIDLNGFLNFHKEATALIDDSQLLNICFLVNELVSNRLKRLQVQHITIAENNSEALSIRFEYHNGCSVNLLMDSLEQKKQQIKVYQKKSYITADLLLQNVIIHHHKDGPKIKVKEKITQEVSVERPVIPQRAFNALQSFIEGDKHEADLETVYEILKICNLIKEKMEVSEMLMQ